MSDTELAKYHGILTGLIAGALGGLLWLAFRSYILAGSGVIYGIMVGTSVFLKELGKEDQDNEDC